jgi:hypothetical protein
MRTGFWTEDVIASPWNRRCWTMQERSLSTRLLHFCESKIYFECRTCLRSEEGETIDPNGPTWPLWRREKKRQHCQSTTSTLSVVDLSLVNELLQRWRRMVEHYSKRHLTQSSDRLVAIHSITQEMSASLPNSYISFTACGRLNYRKGYHGP